MISARFRRSFDDGKTNTRSHLEDLCVPIPFAAPCDYCFAWAPACRDGTRNSRRVDSLRCALPEVVPLASRAPTGGGDGHTGFV
jgi:hypothetical protein